VAKASGVSEGLRLWAKDELAPQQVFWHLVDPYQGPLTFLEHRRVRASIPVA